MRVDTERLVVRAEFVFMQASFVGAMAIADLVKTTLGPKGMVSCPPSPPLSLPFPNNHTQTHTATGKNDCKSPQYDINTANLPALLSWGNSAWPFAQSSAGQAFLQEDDERSRS